VAVITFHVRGDIFVWLATHCMLTVVTF